MPPSDPVRTPTVPVAERLAALEARVQQLESRLDVALGVAAAEPSAALRPRDSGRGAGDELEYEVGQNWFARAGILVLAAGAAFMLVQPYPNLPRGVPALIGLVSSAALFAAAHAARGAFDLASRYVRGGAMALLAFATLRLAYFDARPLLPPGALVTDAALATAAALNLILAYRRGSPRLVVLALAMAGACALGGGSSLLVVAANVLLAVIVLGVALRCAWPALPLAGTVICGAVYTLWTLGNPAFTGAVQILSPSPVAPALWLLTMVVLALAPLADATDDDGELLSSGVALANCVVGYGVFLLHAAKSFEARFAVLQVLASAVFLGLAVLFWRVRRSHGATFFYAMTAYVALSFAIIKGSSLPDVFVWLALESIVVVATAIWFRSRFIVVANFVIFLVIGLGYLVLHERESGISVVFGIVALTSARGLNWQRHRLELKTELMRNAYLLTAFAIFPYALAHLVPTRWVAIAWVGLALGYYAMNFIIRNQKYRWMGHGTLLLAAIFLVAAGHQLNPRDRVVSFLAVGTVLVAVSLLFSHLRRKARALPVPEESVAPVSSSN